jgi:hypothetical protein
MNKIDDLVEAEDDEVTLHQGSEDEGFRSCQPEVPFRDGSDEHPYEERVIDVDARTKAKEHIEATKRS